MAAAGAVFRPTGSSTMALGVDATIPQMFGHNESMLVVADNGRRAEPLTADAQCCFLEQALFCHQGLQLFGIELPR